MSKTNMLVLLGISILGVILGIIFTVDDITGIGEIIDPLEFAFVMIVGYLIGKKI